MKNATDILVDISDNMEGNKQACAKRVLLDEILPLIDFSEITGLKTFMASGPVCLVIRSVDLGINPKSDFDQKINNLPMPNSGAPISNAIRESLGELKKQDADNKRIIIVTAGIDTLAGSYINAVKEAAAEGVQVSVVLIGGTDSAKSAAREAAAEGKGVACFIAGDVYDTVSARAEINNLGAALKGIAAAPVKEEPKVEVKVELQQSTSNSNSSASQSASQEQPKAESKDFISGLKEALKDGGIIDIDDFKQTVSSSINQLGESIQTVFEPIKVNKEDGSTSTEKVDLAEIIAKNKESLSNIQKQASESIAALMESCGKAIAELQVKATDRINELVTEHNATTSNLMKNSEEAFNKLSQEKDEALAKVDQLIEDDKKVIIRTNEDLDLQVETKSQLFLNAHLQKKYPGRVNWVNQNGDAKKGYDFIVDDHDTANNTFEYVIACKGILDDSKTFFLRQREWEACVKNSRNYQVYVLSNLSSSEPTLTVVDNLMDWITSGRIVPCADANIKLKAGHVVFTIK